MLRRFFIYGNKGADNRASERQDTTWPKASINRAHGRVMAASGMPVPDIVVQAFSGIVRAC